MSRAAEFHICGRPIHNHDTQPTENVTAIRVPARHAGLLFALLLGERGEIPEDLQDAFKETGTMHLLVISGVHVGIIGLARTFILQLLGVPRPAQLWLVAAGLGIYCVLVGMRPIRAGGGGVVQLQNGAAMRGYGHRPVISSCSRI